MLGIPRRDVKPLAKDIIDRFNDFAGVVSADVERLRSIPGLGDTVVAAIKLAQASSLRLLRERVVGRETISSWTQLVAYCRATIAHEEVEQLRRLFLYRMNTLIADELQQRGAVDHAPLYIRKVVKRALELGASVLILVHNHPSGDPTPSVGDIKITREVKEAVQKLGIVFHDEVVVERNGHQSFRSLGLLQDFSPPRSRYLRSRQRQ